MGNLIRDTYRALRFFSLTIAFISTSFGIAIAYMDNKVFAAGNPAMDLLRILLVTVAGLLLQSGVNLVNDYFEAKYDKKNPNEKKVRFLGMERTFTEIFIFVAGLACFGAAAFLGLIITYLSTLQILLIGFIGLLGGYFYTGYPFQYKDKGLGALFSFLLMGPLMIYGSYLVFSHEFSFKPLLLSFSIGLLIPALLISNELRDFDYDKANKVKTLCVRTSFEFGRKLYLVLVAGSYIMSLCFVLLGFLPLLSLLVCLTIPYSLKTYRLLYKNKKAFVPSTAYLHLYFGLLLILTMTLSKYLHMD